MAVTAVNDADRVYRLAGRGDHVDFAAPGMRIIVAEPQGGYGLETGTSFAAPFASAAIALRCRRARPCDDAITALSQSAVDLGRKGRDAIYGHGRISP